MTKGTAESFEDWADKFINDIPDEKALMLHGYMAMPAYLSRGAWNHQQAKIDQQAKQIEELVGLLGKGRARSSFSTIKWSIGRDDCLAKIKGEV